MIENHGDKILSLLFTEYNNCTYVISMCEDLNLYITSVPYGWPVYNIKVPLPNMESGRILLKQNPIKRNEIFIGIDKILGKVDIEMMSMRTPLDRILIKSILEDKITPQNR